MQYEDRMTIATPEGVSLEVTLAGAGSRAGAAVLDGLIQFALIFVIGLILGGIGSGAGDFDPSGSDTEFALLAIALLNVLLFVVLFFYYVIFETLWSGQTPGKRAFRLRVVRLSGARVGFRASMIRNLVRIVDLLPPVTYLTGIIAIVTTSKNQRIGDMVAGTVVVHDRQAAAPSGPTWSGPPPLIPSRTEASVPETTRSWDLSAISADDLAAVQAFLERRYTIPTHVREKLATDLDSKLRPKVAGAQDWSGYPEAFLELLAAAKSARS
jgi:uncharacterized RDD family membrane protein YckC